MLGTHIFGARVIRIAGNYDQVNRLCSQIGERYHWGFVNINLRPYYAEGSKTVGYEIAEQLGWRLPDNIVVPMAGGSLITKILQSVSGIDYPGPGGVEACQVFRRAGHRLLAHLDDGQSWARMKWTRRSHTPSRDRWRSAIRPTDFTRRASSAPAADGPKTLPTRKSWRASRLLAASEGIFGETAAGVTVATAKALIAQGRIRPDEETVLCITGNGLKTTDALVDRHDARCSDRTAPGGLREICGTGDGGSRRLLACLQASAVARLRRSSFPRPPQISAALLTARASP